ncbi:MAG: NUDIX hydrolase [Deltaproteobacteria bacterium]|nr:NUDIX hydrolase [Deltaproteobacteria bacterium]HCH65209.1 NUDIX hydrolase [Deltaproteobacteria bacterium]
MNWKNPTPTVDVVVVRRTRSVEVLLIERLNAPHGWALPGGFVDEGERVENAAVREVEEETGLSPRLTSLLYVYSDPARDPRKHTMSVVFTGEVDATSRAEAADDARAVRWVKLEHLASTLSQKVPTLDGQTFAFDHAEILRDWVRFERSAVRPLHIP